MQPRPSLAGYGTANKSNRTAGTRTGVSTLAQTRGESRLPTPLQIASKEQEGAEILITHLNAQSEGRPLGFLPGFHIISTA